METTAVIERIERAAPLGAAAPWDRSGVQIAGRKADVHKLALTLDPLPHILGSALDWGADMVLTHHPLSLEPRYLDKVDAHYEATALMLTREAWLYAAHTSLDANPDGPAGWLFRELGVHAAQVLEPCERDPRLGIGQVGVLPKPVTLAALLDRLAGLVRRRVWNLSGPVLDSGRMISRLACCPGSGGSLMELAAEAGAELYITGDLRFHAAQEAPLPVLDVGHFALEEEMMRRLAQTLAQDGSLPGVEVRFLPGEDPQRPHLVPEAAS